MVPEAAELGPADRKGIDIVPVGSLTQAIRTLLPRSRKAGREEREERVAVTVDGEGEA